MNDVHEPRCEHELRLVPALTEVGRARQFACYVLQERHIAPDRIATAELLVSELVTNAVKMTSTMEPGPPYGAASDHIQPVILRLRLAAHCMAIEVTDGGGKAVWCELDIARGVSASDMTVLLSSLPRRSRSSIRSARRLKAMTDPVLLRRVRDGLLALGPDDEPAK